MKSALLGLLCALHASVALAEVPFQFGTIGVNAPDDPEVAGIRLSFLHGKNERTTGLDVGLLSVSDTKRLTGASFVLGVGRVTEEMAGAAAISLVNLHTSTDRGLNAAFINVLHEAPGAVTVGFLNIADGGTMVDVGGLNVSERSDAQIGFVNVTNEIRGFQFGFINIAKNGFLPVFPIINFAVD